MTIKRFSKTCGLCLTVLLIGTLPVNFTKSPEHPSQPLEGTKLAHTLSVSFESFDGVDVVPVSSEDYVRMEARKYGWESGYQWEALQTLISNESGFRWDAINSSSQACGLFQALPCSKLGAPLEDIANQASWGLSYISGYGSPSVALDFWRCVGNCYSSRTKNTVYKSTTWY